MDVCNVNIPTKYFSVATNVNESKHLPWTLISINSIPGHIPGNLHLCFSHQLDCLLQNFEIGNIADIRVSCRTL